MGDPRAALHAALATELETVGGALEAAAVALCLDPVVFGRHPEPLQSFDRMAQVIGELARLLRCPDPIEQAIGHVRLDTLRATLTHAMAR